MRIFTILIACLFAIPAFADPPTSFGSGKIAAEKLWWKIGPSTIYCDCPYRLATAEEKQIRKGNLWVEAEPCGYKPKQPITSTGKINARPLRVEWEHIVPADWIATGFNCRHLSREQCRAIVGFEEAEGDLFNLFPSVGELNGDRLSKLFDEIDGEEREYGACDFEVSGDKAEPKESIRGDVARVWLYMIDQYGLQVPEDYVERMRAWSAADPVDQIEKDRHKLIADTMKRENNFVTGQ